MTTTMAATTLRKSQQTTLLLPLLIRRTLSTTTKASHHKDHSQNHVYLKPTTFIGSFLEDEQPPQNPKEALSKLGLLRRDYAKQVTTLRKQYIEEVEAQRLEKTRKDEAKKLEMMRQREERRKAKSAAAMDRAAELKASDDLFRATLMKEKAEKLEYWRLKQKKIAEKKNAKKELICQQSSKWINEKDLESKVLEAICDSRIL